MWEIHGILFVVSHLTTVCCHTTATKNMNIVVIFHSVDGEIDLSVSSMPVRNVVYGQNTPDSDSKYTHRSQHTSPVSL